MQTMMMMCGGDQKVAGMKVALWGGAGATALAYGLLLVYNYYSTNPGWWQAGTGIHDSCSIASTLSPAALATLNCQDFGLKEEQKLYYKPGPEFLNASCRSKHEHPCYRKHLPLIPPAFLSVLHDYEIYHDKCTRNVSITTMAMAGDTVEGCKYLVWKAMDGLGNQLLSLVSAFIYSLLTQRAMLIATDSHIQNYLCNPFPFSSWLLPYDFPEPQLRSSAMRVADFVAQTVKQRHNGTHNISTIIPKHLQVFIICCDNARDHPFFCPAAQNLFTDINWVFYHSHEHTMPAFYLIPEFRRRLHQWFPNHDAFMHVSRYLLHPQDVIWENISQFYKSHMDGVAKQVGIQARVWGGNHEPAVSRQISRCAVEQMLLPKPQQEAIDRSVDTLPPAPMMAIEAAEEEKPDIAVLVVSLRPEYREELASPYERKTDAKGAMQVKVLTASAEGSQKTGNETHDKAAMVDMWLLSFMHDMVVTPRSTFGSVASGMAGSVPLLFINYGADRREEAACVRSNVAGPSFLVYPRNVPCDLDSPSFTIRDPVAMVPEVVYCPQNTGLGIESSHYIP